MTDVMRILKACDRLAIELQAYGIPHGRITIELQFREWEIMYRHFNELCLNPTPGRHSGEPPDLEYKGLFKFKAIRNFDERPHMYREPRR